jgi:hypothetical protein
MSASPFGPLSVIGGLLCPLIVFAFIVFVIVMIVRAIGRAGASSRGGGQAPPLSVTTQMGDDGFWIGPCPCDPAALIHFYYWSDGVRHSGQVPYQPGNDGRQFVYTGRRPDQVSIVRIVEQADDTTPDIMPPLVAGAAAMWDSSPSIQPDTSSPPPASSSFPSAY